MFKILISPKGPAPAAFVVLLLPLCSRAQPAAMGVEEAPTSSVYVIGDSGWRVSAPIGYDDSGRGMTHSPAGRSWRRLWNEPRFSQPPIAHTLDIHVEFPIMGEPGTCEPGARRSGVIGEGSNHGFRTYSFSCRGFKQATSCPPPMTNCSMTGPSSEHYLVALAADSVIDLYFNYTTEMPKERSANLNAFRQMQRTLAPTKTTVTKPAAPEPPAAKAPEPPAAKPPEAPSQPSVVPLLR